VRSTLRRYWHAFANAAANFLGEVAFRVGLACRVIVGAVPVEVQKRRWVRSVNKPVLVDGCDWTTNRVLFSIVVYPPVDELDLSKAEAAHYRRVNQIKEIVARGAGDLRLSLYLETEWDMEWDIGREVWIDRDGYAYDASRFGVGTRSGSSERRRNRDA
jgi:hypothetical protein